MQAEYFLCYGMRVLHRAHLLKVDLLFNVDDSCHKGCSTLGASIYAPPPSLVTGGRGGVKDLLEFSARRSHLRGSARDLKSVQESAQAVVRPARLRTSVPQLLV